jgi:CBS domain-containing protein
MKKCHEIMVENPACCMPTDLVLKAVKIMKNEHTGLIPVIENAQTRKLIGILSDYDLALMTGAEGLDIRSTKVKTVMTHKPIICHAEDDFQKALDVIFENQLHRMIVVDDDNRVLGVIIPTKETP